MDIDRDLSPMSPIFRKEQVSMGVTDVTDVTEIPYPAYTRTRAHMISSGKSVTLVTSVTNAFCGLSL